MTRSWQEEEKRWETEAGLGENGFASNVSSDEANWAVAAQLFSFGGFIMPTANILGPLAIWLAKRDESAFIAHHALEALNFQISMTLYLLAAGVLIYVLIGFVLVPVLIVFDVLAIIVAALRASRGELYSYPFCLRLIH
jgi:uncharacterized Tic20 family protein